MSKPPRKFPSIILTCILVAAIGYLAIFLLGQYWDQPYKQASAELAKRIKVIRDRGEPVAFADLQHASDAEFEKGDQASEILALISDVPFEIRELLDSETTWTEQEVTTLSEMVAENEQSLTWLASIEDTDLCRFQYDFEIASPHAILLHQISSINDASHLWRASGLLAIRRHDPENAVQAVQEICDLAELLRHEPFLVSQFVRVRVGNGAVDLLQRILADFELNEEQFRRLDESLAKLETNFRFEQCLWGERATLFTMLQNIGHPEVRESIDMMVGLGAGNLVVTSSSDADSKNWDTRFYRAKLVTQICWVLDQMSEASRLVDKPGKAADKAWIELCDTIAELAMAERDSPYSKLFPAIDDVRKQGFAYRQRLRAARIALRVARYNNIHNSLPENLDKLADQSLPIVPLGLWENDIPKLEETPDGFRILCSGMDDPAAVIVEVTRSENSNELDD